VASTSLTIYGAASLTNALQDIGKAGKVRFVGFDSSEKLVAALGNDQIQGLVVQNPYRMGMLGVKAIIQHLKKEPVEKRIDTGVRLITRDRMNDADARELLHPDLSKWLKP
jgi:ribose transport system substrate-binding protein